MPDARLQRTRDAYNVVKFKEYELSPDAAKILTDNLWSLYATDENFESMKTIVSTFSTAKKDA